MESQGSWRAVGAVLVGAAAAFVLSGVARASTGNGDLRDRLSTIATGAKGATALLLLAGVLAFTLAYRDSERSIWFTIATVVGGAVTLLALYSVWDYGTLTGQPLSAHMASVLSALAVFIPATIATALAAARVVVPKVDLIGMVEER